METKKKGFDIHLFSLAGEQRWFREPNATRFSLSVPVGRTIQNCEPSFNLFTDI
jgi:hypothetical protein